MGEGLVDFKRHLVMQRVQRVNLGDEKVRPEWRRLRETANDEDSKIKAAMVEELRVLNSFMERDCDRNMLSRR